MSRVSSRSPRPAIAVVALAALALLWPSSGGVVAGVGISPAPSSPPPVAPAPDGSSCAGDGTPGDLVCRAPALLNGIVGVPQLPGAPPLAPTQPASGDQPAPAPATPPRPTINAPATDPSPLAAVATLYFGNEDFLQSLLDVVDHPLTDNISDLRHLRILADGSGAAGRPFAATLPIPRARPERRPRMQLWEVLAPAALGALLLAGWLLRRQRSPVAEGSARTRPTGRRAQVAVAAALATVVGASVGAAIAFSVAQRADALSVPVATTIEIPITELRTHEGTPARLVTPWDRMAALEARLVSVRDQLTVLEKEIRRILGTDLEPVGVERAALGPARLDGLLAAHRTTATTYQECLQSEYNLYRSAAGDPEQTRQLLAGAAAAGNGASAMVSYNLQIAQTQLAQERAIARAEALLARYDSSASTRLRGMARQPFTAPEGGLLTQPFGPSDLGMEPPLTYHGVFYRHFHTGIDLAAPLDAPLQAAADGVVLLATASLDARGRLVGYGNYILVAHPDGFATLYGHLSRVLVKTGDVVRQGEVIGLEGSTGLSTGPHVHFEIRQGHELLDPLPLLAQPAA